LGRTARSATLGQLGGASRVAPAPASPARAVQGARGKRAIFTERRLPYLLLFPQLFILLLFFFIPSFRALSQAFLLSDPFGNTSHFVWFDNFTDNFTRLLASPEYQSSIWVTLWFTLATTALTMAAGLVFAFATDRVLRGRGLYKIVVLLPYAVAPAIAGYIWAFLFNPVVGPMAYVLQSLSIRWDPTLDAGHALTLIVLAASWKHVCYNYIFYLAAMLAVPRSVIEAAAVDGAGPIRRFVTIVFPLLGPTTFFLVIMNLVYSLFETFAVVDAVTHGGPGGATNILVYKVYQDGFVNLDLGSSAAQSVILMTFATVLTLLQFRYVERKINYDL
jgi:sn-glycerol 3-phosphate transport system permease protein